MKALLHTFWNRLVGRHESQELYLADDLPDNLRNHETNADGETLLHARPLN